MSDKPYLGDNEIIIAIYDQFGVSMYDAERWFAEIKADEIERLRAALEEIVEHPVGEADDGESMQQIAREALKDDL